MEGFWTAGKKSSLSLGSLYPPILSELFSSAWFLRIEEEPFVGLSPPRMAVKPRFHLGLVALITVSTAQLSSGRMNPTIELYPHQEGGAIFFNILHNLFST